MTEATIIQAINDRISDECKETRKEISKVHSRLDLIDNRSTRNETDITWLKKCHWRTIGAGTGSGMSAGGIIIILGKALGWW